MENKRKISPTAQEIIDSITKIRLEIGGDKEKALQFLKDGGILDIINDSDQDTSIHSRIEILAMDELHKKWDHLYHFGYPNRPFPVNYQIDLNEAMLELYKNNVHLTLSTTTL